MARAQGARARMALAFETTYGTPPASGYGFLIALQGARYAGRVGTLSWQATVSNWWSLPVLYDLDTSGVGFLLSGFVGGEGLASVTAPFQMLEPPSTPNRFAAFLAQNEAERVPDVRMSPSSNWGANFWAVEFLPFPPAEVVLPQGAWRLDPSRIRPGYAVWRGGMAVVNASGGADYRGFAPTENSFSEGKRYWEVECAGDL